MGGKMTTAPLFELFKRTLSEPRIVGAQLIAMNFPKQALWLALAAMAVVMSLLASAMLQMAPLPEGELGDLFRMSPAYRSPLMFAVLQWGQAVIGVFVLTWIGRIFGGEAAVEDMVVVMVWLQIVLFVLALGATAVSILLPPAAPIAMLAYVAWAVWMTLSMVDAAHRFDSSLKALCVLVTAFFALILGSAILASMIGMAGGAGG